MALAEDRTLKLLKNVHPVLMHHHGCYLAVPSPIQMRNVYQEWIQFHRPRQLRQDIEYDFSSYTHFTDTHLFNILNWNAQANVIQTLMVY